MVTTVAFPMTPHGQTKPGVAFPMLPRRHLMYMNPVQYVSGSQTH